MTQAAVSVVDAILNPPQPAPVGSEPVKAETVSTEAAPQKTAPDPKVSGKLSVLAQRERQAWEREKSATAKEAEIKAREDKLQEFETLKATNPLKALELLGLSYQELSQIALADGTIPAEVRVNKLEERLNESEKRQLADREAQLANEKLEAENREKKAVETFKGEISKFLSANTEKYPLIQFHEAEPIVFEVIDENYNRTIDPETGLGKILTFDEACDKVEGHFRKKYESAPEALRNILSPVQTKVIPDKLKEFLPQKPPRTLTNNQSVTQTVKRTKPLTDDERIRQAIANVMGRKA